MADPFIIVKEPSSLIEILTLIHPSAKKNSLRRMIDRGRVRVGQERATRANAKILAGTKVTILSSADGDTPKRNQKLEMPEPSILFSDTEIIVADKPAGLLAVATDRGEFDTMFDRVAKWAWANGQTRAYLVHRLDRETSGCMIFSRSAEARDYLQAQFKSRTVERIYHAVIHGKPANESGTEAECSTVIAAERLGVAHFLPGICPNGLGSTFIRLEKTDAEERGWRLTVMREGVVPQADVIRWWTIPV